MLKKDFPEFEVSTISDNGWNGIKNGKLLSLMDENKFDYLITLDKNLSYQQNLDKFNVKVILVDIKDARIDFIYPLVSKIIEILKSNISEKFITVGK